MSLRRAGGVGKFKFKLLLVARGELLMLGYGASMKGYEMRYLQDDRLSHLERIHARFLMSGIITLPLRLPNVEQTLPELQLSQLQWRRPTHQISHQGKPSKSSACRGGLNSQLQQN